jgi:hypothetical protein
LRLDALRDVAQNHGVAARKIVSRQGEVHDDLRTIVTNEFRTAVLTYLPLMLAYRDFFLLCSFVFSSFAMTVQSVLPSTLDRVAAAVRGSRS